MSTWGSMRGSKKEKGRGVRIDALLGKLIKINYVLIKRLPIKTEFRKGHHPHIPRKTKINPPTFPSWERILHPRVDFEYWKQARIQNFFQGAGPMDNFVFPVGSRPILRILLCEFNKFEIFQSPPPQDLRTNAYISGFFSLPRNLRL